MSKGHWRITGFHVNAAQHALKATAPSVPGIGRLTSLGLLDLGENALVLPPAETAVRVAKATHRSFRETGRGNKCGKYIVSVTWLWLALVACTAAAPSTPVTTSATASLFATTGPQSSPYQELARTGTTLPGSGAASATDTRPAVLLGATLPASPLPGSRRVPDATVCRGELGRYWRALCSEDFPTATPVPTPTPTPTPEPAVPPPPGIVFRTREGVWRVNADGGAEPLVEVAPGSCPCYIDIQTCQDATFALIGSEEGGAWAFKIVELFTQHTVTLDPGEGQVFCCAYWWTGRCDTVLAIIQPWLQVGRYCQGIPAALDWESNTLSPIGSIPSWVGVLSAVSPDGQVLAYTEDSQPWLYRWGTGSEPLDLQGYEFPEVDVGFLRPVWSPDGNRLAWLVWGEIEGEEQEGVAIFDLESRRSELHYPYLVWYGEMPSWLAWSPRGDYLYMYIDYWDVQVIPLDPAGVEQGAVDPALDWQWSPDGQWLAYALYIDTEHVVHVESADGGELHELGQGVPSVWSPDARFLLFDDAESGIWVAEIGLWHPQRLDLPAGAVIVDWLGGE